MKDVASARQPSDTRLDVARLHNALTLSGVVAPPLASISPTSAASDPALRAELLRCCLLAIGDDFVGRDLGPLRSSLLPAADWQRAVAACICDMGLVPNVAPPPQHGGRKAALLSQPATADTALALVAGECQPEAAVRLLHSLADIIETCVYCGSSAALDEEYSRCTSVQRLTLENARAVFSKQCSVFPSSVPAPDKMKARSGLDRSAGGLTSLQQQNAALRDEVAGLRDKLRLLEKGADHSVATPMAPEEMATRHSEWRAAVSDLLAGGAQLVNRVGALQLPDSGAAGGAASDQLSDLAASVASRAAALAALPSAAEHVRTVFDSLDGMTENLTQSLADSTPPDHSWARRYSALAP